ncbi:leucine-rich repeat-containing protein 14-like [Mizuhopecten yessoensis]|uniref:Leucine-rich repeat-containing protein 14 n=1 Tax=Mizuhopecten yessoensis TaxID=6573 RepID=A0A210QGT1_MIZYE|nr:leucine-rich repeat-containing protein 14-like [Mizuhopecten yessoensis]OWF47983.1 Leucine-rich repeat-containing protein 14 [Mizuhopecten yessoensis]
MQASLQYDHYQGAVYPLDLHAEPNHGQYRKTPIKSLVNLCAEYIVRDATVTKEAVQHVPHHLSVALMQAALLDNRDRSMETLISHWPLNSLTLKKLAPTLFTSVVPLYNSTYLSDIVRQSLRYTTCLSHTFLECLKKRTPTKLKYLDMTGFPTAEVILFYLATHCMLAHNEARQTVMVDMYNRVVTLLPDQTESDKSSYQLMTADTTIPDSSFTVKMDAFVTSDQTHAELCKALKVSGFQDSKLKIVLETLDATCLGEQKLHILLQQVNPKFLQGLRLKYNALNCEDFCKLSPVLERFNSLIALDLSCNSIRHKESCDSLAQLLSALPHLIRLDLSNNRVKTRLRQILSNMPSALQYLRLVGCGLALTDIAYLSVSHHMSGLTELDLSENNLQPAAANFSKLLKSCKSMLHTLEIQDCKLRDDSVELFTGNLASMESLMYVNLSNNSLSLPVHECVLEAVAGLPSLQAYRLSFSKDCYSPDLLDDELDMKKDMCVAQMYHVMRSIRGEASLPHLMFVELERLDDVE